MSRVDKYDSIFRSFDRWKSITECQVGQELVAYKVTTHAIQYTATLRRSRITTVAVKKAINVYTFCVSEALGIQQAKRVRHIAICGLPRSVIYSTFSHKQHDCRKRLLNMWRHVPTDVSTHLLHFCKSVVFLCALYVHYGRHKCCIVR